MTSLIFCLKSSGSFIINWVMQTFSTKVFTSILLILRGIFCLSQLGMYINLLSNVLSLKIPDTCTYCKVSTNDSFPL